MKHPLRLLLRLLALALVQVDPAQAGALPQRVLYVGHRAGEFEPFLKQHFSRVQSVPRSGFQPAQAKDFDVVLLDWPQSGDARGERTNGTPLGQRENWDKPTVLLGSAGLNLAVAWKLKGGSGCTCLAPVAYGLVEHLIFKSPIAVNVRATKSISTPKTFAPELKEPSVDVLPLVDGIRRYETVINDYKRGWCVYFYEFSDVPDVEFFCGGINEKTPRAAAFWRQGNLLHFGFDQSSAELNETGRSLLVNATAYISRFTEDRPIDLTPSVFSGERIGISRRRAKSYLTNPEYKLEWATNVFSAATLTSFNSRDRVTGTAWFEANRPWLHPGEGNYLEVDTDAKLLGTPFDAPEFLPKTIAALREEKHRTPAARMLARYAPSGPGATASPAAWEKWWQENQLYVFYSELGGYRWYVDPLAKKRGIPSKDLRGTARADPQR